MSRFKNDVLIYLSGPLTHPDVAVKARRKDVETKAVAHLKRKGFMVYGPLTYSEPIARLVPEMTHEDWMAFDYRILRFCDALYLLTAEGWLQSKGVRLEYEFGVALGKPVSTMDPETNEVKSINQVPRWES